MKCPHCNKEINTRDSNAFGMTRGSKGDFICQYVIKHKAFKFIEVLTALEKKYPDQSNDARAMQVLYDLKRRGFIYQQGSKYHHNEDTIATIIKEETERAG